MPVRLPFPLPETQLWLVGAAIPELLAPPLVLPAAVLGLFDVQREKEFPVTLPFPALDVAPLLVGPASPPPPNLAAALLRIHRALDPSVTLLLPACVTALLRVALTPPQSNLGPALLRTHRALDPSVALPLPECETLPLPATALLLRRLPGLSWPMVVPVPPRVQRGRDPEVRRYAGALASVGA